MSDADLTAPTESGVPLAGRRWAVLGGRVLLAVLLLLAWELGARTIGSLFFASPLAVLVRISEHPARDVLALSPKGWKQQTEHLDAPKSAAATG